jgi:hypothetical protein
MTAIRNEESARHADVRSWVWHAGRGAVIWQLMFPDERMVAGLKRFPESRKASLFCLDAASGRMVTDDFVPMIAEGSDTPVGDGWMIGLETIHGGLLFCHTFQQGSPEHQGIWALDLRGGLVAWSRPEAVFAANLGTSLLVYRNRFFAGFPEREYWLLDPLTGEVLEALGTGHERPNLLRMSAVDEETRQGIILPEVRASDTGPVEFIDAGPVSVEGLHVSSILPGAWRSSVRVRIGGQIVYEGNMSPASPAPLFNNFLIRGSTLYYIKENEELIGVQLS